MSEEIDVKVGTKEEALWTKVKKEAEAFIQQSEDNLIIQKGLLRLANQRIAEEEKKRKT